MAIDIGRHGNTGIVVKTFQSDNYDWYFFDSTEIVQEKESHRFNYANAFVDCYLQFATFFSLTSNSWKMHHFFSFKKIFGKEIT